MQILQTPQLFSFPKTLNAATKPFQVQQRHSLFLGNQTRFPDFTVKSYSSDEFPADEEFLKKFAVRDKPTDEEERRINWTVRGWAPWDEILTPEGNFARKSLNEGEEVPLKNPEAIEAFKMLNATYRRKKMEEMGLTEDEFYRKQFEIKGEKPPPLETTWTGPMLLGLVPPRDWPPRGWEVDRTELAFIREAHKMQNMRVSVEELEGASKEIDTAYLERYKVFLKQYQEWVAANKDRLEKESYKYDQDYYPGRRKRGKDYKEGMYELPFYYPGQICSGEVTTLHLYQGAFVDIGGVYDGWVPIKGNDWFWLRHHIKVGMHVFVEVVAKRDPYRFRFPIELRLIYPNIDHMIFNRFDFPPIFYREDDNNPDELRRDSGRPPVPRKDPGDKPEEESLKSEHPYVYKLWQIHNAEQMILDDMETNPDKYNGKKLSELVDNEDFDEENSVEYSKAYYKKTVLPRVILKTSLKELDLEAALEERELHNKLRREAEERGEEYEVHKLRRNVEMDEYDFMHWRRSFEEREALLRDIACRKALDLPLEEPGRYVDPSHFGKEDKYDPSSPLYRYDYWGLPKNSEEGRLARIAMEHNKSIVGDGTVMSEMSYDDYIKLTKLKEAQSKDEILDVDDDLTDDDSDSEDELDIAAIFNSLDTDSSDQPHINGTEVYPLSGENMFTD